MVSVSCFGVRVSVMFHFMFVHYTFSSVCVAEWPPFGKSCPLGLLKDLNFLLLFKTAGWASLRTLAEIPSCPVAFFELSLLIC